MKDYIEIAIKTTHACAELVADLLSEFTEDGVFIADAQDAIDLERSGKNWDYADDGVINCDPTVTVKGYVKTNEKDAKINGIRSALKRLKENTPFDTGALSVFTAETDGNEWREKWKENFRPIHIGKIVVVPEWIDYKPAAYEKTVRIGTDMAFGTGEHETTSMCVEMLQRYVRANDTVIDVGCGSGILGIAASKLGAKRVVMTDLDECAVSAAGNNVRLNGVQGAEIYLKNLLDDSSVKGDVIVANIIAEVLIGFSEGVKNHLNTGGTVILSGILKDRADKVIAAYAARGFSVLRTETRGEWTAIAFKGAQ